MVRSATNRRRHILGDGNILRTQPEVVEPLDAELAAGLPHPPRSAASRVSPAQRDLHAIVELERRWPHRSRGSDAWNRLACTLSSTSPYCPGGRAAQRMRFFGWWRPSLIVIAAPPALGQPRPSPAARPRLRAPAP